MSIISGISPLPLLLRLTTPQVTVKHATLTTNKTFNTNLQPSLAFLIRKVSFLFSPLDAPQGSATLAYLTAQLTENTTNTAPVLSDPLAIASAARLYSASFLTSGAVTYNQDDIQVSSETFGGFAYPTVAASLNLTAQVTETFGTFTNGFNVSAYVWYEIKQVDQALQAYLSNRLALQR